MKSIFSFLKREKKPPTVASSPEPQKPAVAKMGVYPDHVGEANVRYIYVLNISPLPGKDINDILGDRERVVDVSVDGETILLIDNDVAFAYIEDKDKARMVKDFIRKGDPVNAVLLSDGERANLRFYMDKKKYVGKRESTVVTLTGYKGGEKQDNISCLRDAEELQADEEGGVIDLRGSAIGKLPSAARKKAEEEGFFAMFLEAVEETENEDTGEVIYIPSVRIYW